MTCSKHQGEATIRELIKFINGSPELSVSLCRVHRVLGKPLKHINRLLQVQAPSIR